MAICFKLCAIIFLKMSLQHGKQCNHGLQHQHLSQISCCPSLLTSFSISLQGGVSNKLDSALTTSVGSPAALRAYCDAIFGPQTAEDVAMPLAEQAALREARLRAAGLASQDRF
ncbi:MAG: hypothetical protein LBH06_02230 [Rikenellaceae bacterium]|jgi:hypothetical protein|nr:hypothetical protein [Rikenellaceae bacterium]